MRVVLLALLGTLLTGPRVRAQSLVDPILPGGTVGLNFSASHQTWSSRYGPRGVEPLGSDLTSANAATLFPGIAALEQDLRSLTGSKTGFPSVLGPVSARVSQGVDRVAYGARLGVFDWLTIGAMVPVVRHRTPIDVYFRPDTLIAPWAIRTYKGNLGLSPAATGDGGVSTLLTALSDAATAARNRAASLCANGPASAGCASATDLAQRVSTFSGEARSAYYASPFFPLAGTPAAAALTSALASLNQDLTGAGIATVQAPFVFASQQVDPATFNQIPATPSYGIDGTALQTVDGLWQLGDVEISAMVRLLRGEVRDSGSAEPRLAWELAAGGLVRLGTGKPPNPAVFYDVGSGDGQTDFEGRLYGALRFGRHVEIRSEAQYGVQRSAVQLRRVAPPGTILAPYSAVTPVRWTPGSYLNVHVSPRWYLATGLSLTFDYDSYTKASDRYAPVSGPQGTDTTLDVSVLDQQTSMTLQRAGVGLTYSTLQGPRGGHNWLPAELDARFIQAIAGSGGRTPKAQEFQIVVRVYRRLWGRKR